MAEIKIRAIPLSTLATAGLDPVIFAPINIAPGLPYACFDVSIYNVSTATLFLSYDGATVSDVILPNTTFSLPGSYNTQPAERYGVWAKGQIFYVRSGTAPAGSIYLSGYYVR